MKHRIIAQNRKAYHDYHILDKFEAGIVLVGSEVKSLRQSKVSIAEAHVYEMGGEMYLLNSYIPEYLQANRFNHEPRRPRKLLLHQKQISKLIGKLRTKGLTIVPLSLYFNEKNRAKIEIALVQGKKLHDKRATEKARDWDREKSRMMRDK
jgi:SsrA-binding protein